jgi:protocatechuate 3,4-dioxygenase beta subunit
MTQPHDHSHGELEDHDLGLSHDLPRIVERNRLGRRGMLGLFGGLGVAALAGCAGSDDTSTGSNVEVAAGEIPEETAGPFPADGSNGVNVLTESGVVRSDITASFGSASGVADGVPMTIRMKVYDLDGEDATVLAGAAVYVWHCDRDGEYSMYSDTVGDENYLRGVQEADADGVVEFNSIFPACYPGRWPHIHFEVYKSVAAAANQANKIATSQIAMPLAANNLVYATSAYAASATNQARITLATDGVFSDGASLELATVTGDVTNGMTAALTIGI